MSDIKKTAGKRRVRKASFLSSQRRIKKGLGIQHTIQTDALQATGRCLEEAAQNVIKRWTAFAEKQDEKDDGKSYRTLTGPLALDGLLSIVPPKHRAEVSAYVNDSLDAFHGIRV